MQIKKFLQIADNLRNEGGFTVSATKSCLSADVETATQDLKTQEIELTMSQSPGAATGKYLSSITSLTIRLPAFDHVSHNNKAYMRIKCDDFLFARNTAVEGSKQFVVIPTEDSRISVIVIPLDCISQQS